ncbi:MAG: hypothetical protein COB85_01580 [Bacteroidetes bacterium]|nr:MAG: hypothetical protein COB85_01580 [Bacteroidota bacterium]
MVKANKFIASALITLTFLFLSNLSYGQKFEWAIGIGGEGIDQSRSIAADDWGNLLVTGTYSLTVDFDPGPDSLNKSSNSGTDFYVAKYDAGGNILWVNALGGFGNDYGGIVQTDVFGNVYVIGSFQYTVDFDPGTNSFELTTNGSSDIFIAKYKANGNFLWAKNIGGITAESVSTSVLDAEGNIFIAGTFDDNIDFDPGPGTAKLWSSNSKGDVFFAKYDNNGNYIWAKSVGGSFSDYCYSMDVDASGNVYLTGGFWEWTDLDPGPGTAYFSGSISEIYIAKYDKNGSYLWAKSMGGSSIDIGNGISVDALGNLYITGLMNDTVDFDPGAGVANLISNGSFDIFLAKYDNYGNYLWANNFGGYYADQGLGICTDGEGKVYMIGHFDGAFIDFDPDSGYATISSHESQDAFVAHYDTDGNYIWVGAWGGAEWDLGNAITKDRFGNVYALGHFQDTVDFDFGDDTFKLAAIGVSDAYIAKYSGGLTEAYQSPISTGPLELIAYPNPSTERLFIETISMAQGLWRIEIIDVVGKKVYSESVFISNIFQHELDVSAYSSGIYFLTLDNNVERSIVKIVIQ